MLLSLFVENYKKGLIKMTNEPILTLFLLTYNQENSIRKTIESILAQKTKYPFIVKILEDCSTDKTLEICKEYVEKYPHLFKLIAQKVNTKGLHCRIAREKEVNTKYWCFIEGDDWYLNDLWIEKGVSFLEQNQDYNCYCGDVLYSNEAENTKQSCVTEVQKNLLKNLDTTYLLIIIFIFKLVQECIEMLLIFRK